MTPDWACHAWENDQRIASITSQMFRKVYRKRVPAKTVAHFDCSPMNPALTEVHSIDLALKPRLLPALQVTRHIEGRDIGSCTVVTGITAELLADGEHHVDAATLSVHRYVNEDLTKRTHVRTSTAQALIMHLDLTGIPLMSTFGCDLAKRSTPLSFTPNQPSA